MISKLTSIFGILTVSFILKHGMLDLFVSWLISGGIYIVYYFLLGLEQFLLELIHAFSSGHHHFHDQNWVLFVLGYFKLFPSTFPQRSSPWLSFFIIPMELCRKLVHLSIESNDLDIGQTFLLHDQMLDWFRKYLLYNFGITHCIPYYIIFMINYGGRN